MIILFSGSHGTGKSTLVELLSQKFPSFQVADSISEKFFKREDFKDKERMPQLQRNFTNYQLGIFKQDNTISSRSYADIWAYTKHLYHQTGNEEYLDQLHLIEDEAKQHLPKAILVYFPIHFEITGKELRSTNKEFQREIDDFILQFFKRLNIKPIEIKAGTPQERLEQLIKEIEIYENQIHHAHDLHDNQIGEPKS